MNRTFYRLTSLILVFALAADPHALSFAAGQSLSPTTSASTSFQNARFQEDALAPAALAARLIKLQPFQSFAGMYRDFTARINREISEPGEQEFLVRYLPWTGAAAGSLAAIASLIKLGVTGAPLVGIGMAVAGGLGYLAYRTSIPYFVSRHRIDHRTGWNLTDAQRDEVRQTARSLTGVFLATTLGAALVFARVFAPHADPATAALLAALATPLLTLPGLWLSTYYHEMNNRDWTRVPAIMDASPSGSAPDPAGQPAPDEQTPPRDPLIVEKARAAAAQIYSQRDMGQGSEDSTFCSDVAAKYRLMIRALNLEVDPDVLAAAFLLRTTESERRRMGLQKAEKDRLLAVTEKVNKTFPTSYGLTKEQLDKHRWAIPDLMGHYAKKAGSLDVLLLTMATKLATMKGANVSSDVLHETYREISEVYVPLLERLGMPGLSTSLLDEAEQLADPTAYAKMNADIQAEYKMSWPEMRDYLDKTARDIQKDLPEGVVISWNLKTVGAVMRKLRSDKRGYGHVGEIRDILRFSVILTNADQQNDVTARIAKHFEYQTDPSRMDWAFHTSFERVLTGERRPHEFQIFDDQDAYWRYRYGPTKARWAYLVQQLTLVLPAYDPFEPDERDPRGTFNKFGEKLVNPFIFFFHAPFDEHTENLIPACVPKGGSRRGNVADALAQMNALGPRTRGANISRGRHRGFWVDLGYRLEDGDEVKPDNVPDREGASIRHNPASLRTMMRSASTLPALVEFELRQSDDRASQLAELAAEGTEKLHERLQRETGPRPRGPSPNWLQPLRQVLGPLASKHSFPDADHLLAAMGLTHRDTYVAERQEALWQEIRGEMIALATQDLENAGTPPRLARYSRSLADLAGEKGMPVPNAEYALLAIACGVLSFDDVVGRLKATRLERPASPAPVEAVQPSPAPIQTSEALPTPIPTVPIAPTVPGVDLPPPEANTPTPDFVEINATLDLSAETSDTVVVLIRVPKDQPAIFAHVMGLIVDHGARLLAGSRTLPAEEGTGLLRLVLQRDRHVDMTSLVEKMNALRLSPTNTGPRPIKRVTASVQIPDNPLLMKNFFATLNTLLPLANIARLTIDEETESGTLWLNFALSIPSSLDAPEISAITILQGVLGQMQRAHDLSIQHFEVGPGDIFDATAVKTLEKLQEKFGRGRIRRFLDGVMEKLVSPFAGDEEMEGDIDEPMPSDLAEGTPGQEDEESLIMVQDAIRLMEKFHSVSKDGERRDPERRLDGRDYAVHPASVMALLLRQGERDPVILIGGGLLHDVLENGPRNMFLRDHPGEKVPPADHPIMVAYRDRIAQEIRDTFRMIEHRLINIITLMTNYKKAGYALYGSRFRDEASIHIQAAKSADGTDNLRIIFEVQTPEKPNFPQKQIAKRIRFLLPVVATEPPFKNKLYKNSRIDFLKILIRQSNRISDEAFMEPYVEEGEDADAVRQELVSGIQAFLEWLESNQDWLPARMKGKNFERFVARLKTMKERLQSPPDSSSVPNRPGSPTGGASVTSEPGRIGPSAESPSDSAGLAPRMGDGSRPANPLSAHPSGPTRRERNIPATEAAAEPSEPISLPERLQNVAPELFVSFKDFMSLVNQLYYRYRAGIGPHEDFSTLPVELSPLFGRMIAEHLFSMWQHMRHNESLSPQDVFHFVEFGGGTGILSRDVMRYVESRASHGSSSEWRDFWNQLHYTIIEQSARLHDRQAAEGRDYIDKGKMDAVLGEAQAKLATLMGGRIKGVIFTNELLDDLGSHKVVLTTQGEAEVAFVIPQIPIEHLALLDEIGSGQELNDLIRQQDAEVRDRTALNGVNVMYLTRSSFEKYLSAVGGLPPGDIQSRLASITYTETYVPSQQIPEVAEHLQRNAEDYATALASHEQQRWTIFANTEADSFVENVGRALEAGFIFTLDYGHSAPDLFRHLHTGAPQHHIYGGEVPLEEQLTPPYHPRILQQQITADLNFTALANRGEDTALHTTWFGLVRDLMSGTSVREQALKGRFGPNSERQSPAALRDFLDESTDTGRFKILIQEKKGEHATPYRYSDATARPSLRRSLNDIPVPLRDRVKNIRDAFSKSHSLESASGLHPDSAEDSPHGGASMEGSFVIGSALAGLLMPLSSSWPLGPSFPGDVSFFAGLLTPLSSSWPLGPSFPGDVSFFAMQIVGLVVFGYLTILLLNFAFRLLERKVPADAEASLGPGPLERREPLGGTRRLYTHDEARGGLPRTIASAGDLRSITPPRMDEILSDNRELINKCRAAFDQLRGLAVESPSRPKARWIRNAVQLMDRFAIFTRTLFLMLTPPGLVSYTHFLIPFGNIDYNRWLNKISVVVFEEEAPGHQTSIASSMDNKIFIGRKLAERLTPDQLAGLLARKMIEIQAKHIVRDNNLRWSSLVERIERIAKAEEIRIAGPGQLRGTSSIDDVIRYIQYESNPLRTSAPITHTWQNAQHVMQWVMKILASSRGSPSLIAIDRTTAWEQTLEALIWLGHPLSVYDGLPGSGISDPESEFIAFERTLLTELEFGAPNIDDQNIRGRFIVTWNRLRGSSESLERVRRLETLNPKDLLAHLIVLFMFRRRDLPLLLNQFWISGEKIENRSNLQYAAQALSTPFGPKIHDLLNALSDIWPLLSKKEYGGLLGGLGTLLRSLTEFSESMTGTRGAIPTVSNVLSNLIREWKPDESTPRRTIKSKSVYTALEKAIREIAGLRETIPLSMILGVTFDPLRRISVHPDLEIALHYYEHIKEHVIPGAEIFKQCLIRYTQMLQRYPGDASAALQESSRYYRGSLKQRREADPIQISDWLEGPGAIEIPIHLRQYSNAMESRMRCWKEVRAGLASLLIDPNLVALRSHEKIDPQFLKLLEMEGTIRLRSDEQLSKESEIIATSLRSVLLSIVEAIQRLHLEARKKHTHQQAQMLTGLRDEIERLTDNLLTLQNLTREIQRQSLKSELVILDAAYKPFESLFVGFPGTHGSLDFTYRYRQHILHNIRAYWENPWIHAVYAFLKTEENRGRDRLARFSIARSQEGPLLATSNVYSVRSELDFLPAFLMYMKVWADVSGRPIIFPATLFDKDADKVLGAGYQLVKTPLESPLSLVIPNTEDGGIFHSELTPGNPTFPVKVVLDKYFVYTPDPAIQAQRRERMIREFSPTSEPRIGRPARKNSETASQEGMFTILSAIVGFLPLVDAHHFGLRQMLVVIAATGIFYLAHVGLHLALGGGLRLLAGKNFYEKAHLWLTQGYRENPPEIGSDVRLALFYFLPGAIQFLTGAILLNLAPLGASQSALLTAFGAVNLIQGMTIFFGADHRHGKKYLPSMRSVFRSA